MSKRRVKLLAVFGLLATGIACSCAGLALPNRIALFVVGLLVMAVAESIWRFWAV